MKLLSGITLCLLLTLFFATTTTTQAHNITRILAKHPEFSSFNHYLTITHLAAEINRRLTITVCAVDNAGMADLLSKHLSIFTIKNVLALHVFSDYFGSKKLHQITHRSTLTATMFQATGKAEGISGYVNITDVKGGRVGFAQEDNAAKFESFFVKTIVEKPYNISVIQISQILTSPEAEAPVAAPSVNITDIMKAKGCKAFSDLLTSEGALDTFVQTVDGGLTIFCPSDDVLKAFMPKYKNLTEEGKMLILLYHGVADYNSMGTLRSHNGVMNTLALEGVNSYNFTVQNDDEGVALKTKVVTASIKATLVDDEPLAVYKIDKVLLPRELFNTDAPKSKKGSTSEDDEEAEAPGPSDDEDAADDTASDENSSTSIGGVRIVVTALLGLSLGALVSL